MAAYDTIRALRNGETVELEGCSWVLREGEIEPGDWYIAERNTGPKLLTAKTVDLHNHWIVPQEPAYVYDLRECVRVNEV